MFTGAKGIRISGNARLTSVQNTYQGGSGVESLDEGIRLLTARVVTGAMHNSGERFDAPTCHENTRVAVQDDILGWADELVDDLSNPELITWMYGPAGSGKSAIAQTIAQRLSSQGRLTASFFFSRARGSERRGTEANLVPTLAHQLSLNIPATKPRIAEAVRSNPLVFDLALQDQVDALIVGPLTAIRETASAGDMPMVIVVDGLDECRQEESAQRRVVDALISGLRRLPPNVQHKLFITSRPEHHIQAIFRKYDAGLIRTMELDDTWDPDSDIWTLLIAGFADIRRHHPYFQGRRAHQTWPSVQSVSNLVRKASGQFIYASTVLKYIKSDENYSPVERLEAILRLENNGDQPYMDLDALYEHIFSRVPDIHIILAILSLDSMVRNIVYRKFSLEAILDALLNEDAERIRFRLRPLVSLLTWPSDSKKISYAHASLPDFLHNPSRSHNLCTHSLNVSTMVLSRIMHVLTDRLAFQEPSQNTVTALPYIATLYADSPVLSSEQKVQLWSLMAKFNFLPNLLSEHLRHEDFDSYYSFETSISGHMDWVLARLTEPDFPPEFLTNAVQVLVDQFRHVGFDEKVWPFSISFGLWTHSERRWSKARRPLSTDNPQLRVCLKICGCPSRNFSPQTQHQARQIITLHRLMMRLTPSSFKEVYARRECGTIANPFANAFRLLAYHLIQLPEKIMRAMLVPAIFSNLDSVMRCSILLRVQTYTTASTDLFSWLPETPELFLLAALVAPLVLSPEVGAMPETSRGKYRVAAVDYTSKAFEKFPFLGDPTSARYIEANTEVENTLVSLGIKSRLHTLADIVPIVWSNEEKLSYTTILNGFRAIDKRAYV